MNIFLIIHITQTARVSLSFLPTCFGFNRPFEADVKYLVFVLLSPPPFLFLFQNDKHIILSWTYIVCIFYR